MIDFAEVEKSVRALKAQFEAGRMDEETLESRLLELIDVADDGYHWMFGHQTERWYRYDNDQWVLATPDGLASSPSSSPSPSNEENGADPTSSEPVVVDWDTLDLGWFMAGLVFIGAIGFVIYSTSL